MGGGGELEGGERNPGVGSRNGGGDGGGCAGRGADDDCGRDCGGALVVVGSGVHLNSEGYREPRRWPWWVTVLLGVVWALSLGYSSRTGEEVMAEGAGPVYAVFVDRELRALDAAEGATGWRRWALGLDEEGEEDEALVLEELRETLNEGARLGALDEGGHQARMVLALRADDADAAREADVAEADDGSAAYGVLRNVLDGEEPRSSEMRVLSDLVSSGEAFAWEVWLLRRADELTLRDWGSEGVYDRYEDQNERFADRVVLVTGWVVVVTWLGMAVFPVVWWQWRSRPGRREVRFLSTWGVATVLGVYFGVELVSDMVLEVFWMGLTWCPVEIPDWYWSLMMMFGDLLWRVLPVVFATVLLFRRPSHMVRSFRLAPQGPLLSILAVFGILWIGNGVLMALTGDGVVTDPTDFLDEAEMGPGMMAFGVLSSCVIAPITEEFIYRGVLFLGLRRHIGPWAALAVSSVLFGVVHWQYDWMGILGVTMMGVTSAALVWRTGSLFPSMVLHGVFNLIISVQAYVLYQWPM